MCHLRLNIVAFTIKSCITYVTVLLYYRYLTAWLMYNDFNWHHTFVQFFQVFWCFLMSFSCLLWYNYSNETVKKCNIASFAHFCSVNIKETLPLKVRTSGDVVKVFFQVSFYYIFFFKTKEFLFQDKGFINVESRLASIRKGMINQFLVGLGLLICQN